MAFEEKVPLASERDSQCLQDACRECDQLFSDRHKVGSELRDLVIREGCPISPEEDDVEGLSDLVEGLENMRMYFLRICEGLK